MLVEVYAVGDKGFVIDLLYHQVAAVLDAQLGGFLQVRTAEILIPKGPRLGKTVVRAENLTKGFGDKLLIEDLSFDVPPGAIRFSMRAISHVDDLVPKPNSLRPPMLVMR